MEKKFFVTARKWRPQRFDEVVGQEALAKALKHAFQTGRIAHAYLFSGIRGVGKTTTARLLAKALNCLDLKDGEPCNQCSSCRAIQEGSAIDVLEIDGASHRGIDAIRDLRDTVNYMPASLRYKVYIIDEVHMLTTEASNSLLKTLEEPPPHVIFILATTEVHKLLPTIRSRCQHYVFKKIPVTKISEQLIRICEAEGIVYEKEAIHLIAEAGDGSLRDAESIFDQVVIYTEGKITFSAVQEILGVSPSNLYEELWKAILQGDAVGVLRAIDQYSELFGDVRGLLWGMISFLKQGLLVKKLSASDELLDMTEEKYERYRELFASVEGKDILRIMQLIADFLRGLRGERNDRLVVEMVCFQLMDYKHIIPLGEIRDELLRYLQSGRLVGGAVRSAQDVHSPAVKQSPQGVATPTTGREKESFSPRTTQNAEKKDSDVKMAFSSEQPLSLIQDGQLLERFRAALQRTQFGQAMKEHLEKIEMQGNTFFVYTTSRLFASHVKNNARNLLFELGADVEKAFRVEAVLVEAKLSSQEPQSPPKAQQVSPSPEDGASPKREAEDTVDYVAELFGIKNISEKENLNNG